MNWLMGLVAVLIALFGPALVRVPPHHIASARRRRRADVRRAMKGTPPPRRADRRRARRGEAPRPAPRRVRMERDAWWVLALFGLPIAAWYYVVAGWWGAIGGTAIVVALAAFGPGPYWWAWALGVVLLFAWFAIFHAWWMAVVGGLFIVGVVLLGHLESRRQRRAALQRHAAQDEPLR